MTLFWTDPSALMWTNPSALFWESTPWTESWFGVVGAFDEESGVCTISGSGAGVGGAVDTCCFASQAASGNVEFYAYISSQTGADPDATAGIMARNSLSRDAQCAAVTVSPENGVNFIIRTANGDDAQTTLGPSLTAPIWLRLVVSQSSVAGYASADGINWRLIGEGTMIFSTDYFVGIVAASNTTLANTATVENIHYLTDVVQRSASLISWLRADSGIRYDDSNNVSFWTDQSANGYSGSQVNSANQPTLVTNAVNGLPSIEFTPGTDSQFLQFPAGFDFTAGLSLLVVVNPTSMSAGSTILDFRNFSGSGSSDQFGLSELNSSGGAQFYAFDGSTGSSGSFSAALTANEFQLLEAVYDGVSSVSVYTNGVLQGTQSSLQTLANIVRANNFLGQAGDGSAPFAGRISEVLVFSTNLSDTAREAVESYLIGKYSL
ncbi:MAG TPA: LamG-like jellyroll fold domain-containing protein [Oculatellaceae cyanobacterium]